MRPRLLTAEQARQITVSPVFARNNEVNRRIYNLLKKIPDAATAGETEVSSFYEDEDCKEISKEMKVFFEDLGYNVYISGSRVTICWARRS